jgi:predicted nucleic acid-binding protein
MRTLLDTSVLISCVEGKLTFEDLSTEATISAVTLCELHHGVLIASDAERARRLRTLDVALRSFDALPADYRVAPYFGQLMADARRSGKGRPEVADALIAATAMAYGLPILSSDRDFTSFDVVEVVLV